MLVSIGSMLGCKKSGCTDPNSCNYDANAGINDGTCINKGQVTFWQDQSADAFDVVVTVNATESTITTNLDNQPLCDASGTATFSLCPGSHSYSAHQKLPGVKTWNGTVLASEDGCIAVRLN